MISIIIIQYNRQNLTIQAIESIKRNCRDGYEIILVDNGSKESNLEELRSKFPNISIIANSENEGFGKANNLGAGIASGNILLFLNNDAVVTSDFTSVIENEFTADPSIGIIGPKLLNADLSLQLSYGRLPSLVNEFRTRIISGLFYKNNKIIVRSLIGSYKRRKNVGFVTGAALFIRKEIFERVGGFDTRMFMYFEDSDLCRRIRDNGGKVVYYPGIEMIHLRGASRDNKNTDLLARYYRQSQLIYYKKHRSVLENSLLKGYLRLSKKYPTEECKA